MHHVVWCTFSEFFLAMPAPCHGNSYGTCLLSLNHVTLGVAHIKSRHILIPGYGLFIFLAKPEIVLYVTHRHASSVINQGNKYLAWSVVTRFTFPVLLHDGHVDPLYP